MAQDRGGQVKGHVGDEDSAGWRSVAQDVPLGDAHVRADLSFEFPDASRVDLDSLKGAPEATEGEGDGAVARAPFHDRTGPFPDKPDDAVKHRAVNKEVLAEFMAAGQ